MQRTAALVGLWVALSFTVHARQAGEERFASYVPASAQPGIVLLAVDDATRPWVQLISDGFRDVASKAPEQPVLFFESLDAARFDDATYAEHLREWLRFKYRNIQVNLVVTVGEDALAFLARQRGEPWPGSAVLFVEVGSISVHTDDVLSRVSGLILEDHFPAAVETIKRILPDTERIVLVFGASEMEATRFSGYTDKVRRTGLGHEPEVLAGLPIADTLERVRALPAHTAVMILQPAVDSSGYVFTPAGPCEVIAPAASGPSFTLGM